MLEALISGLAISLGFYAIVFHLYVLSILLIILFQKIFRKQKIRSSFSELSPFLKAILLLHAIFFIPLILLNTLLYLELYFLVLGLTVILLITGIFVVKWIAKKITKT